MMAREPSPENLPPRRCRLRAAMILIAAIIAAPVIFVIFLATLDRSR